MLIEAAHCYRLPARIARRKLKAVDAVPRGSTPGTSARGKAYRGQAPAVREIAWKAQTKLCQRYRQMMARDKLKQIVVAAIARDPRVKPKDQDWLGSSGPLPASPRIRQRRRLQQRQSRKGFVQVGPQAAPALRFACRLKALRSAREQPMDYPRAKTGGRLVHKPAPQH